MKLFGIVYVLSLLVVLVGFELFQWFSIAAGQIPPRGIHTWAGKPFLHWDMFVCQRYGDLFFLSALNAAVVVALGRVKLTSGSKLYLAVIATLAIIATILWVMSVKKQFASGVFNRWDWGFTAPNGAMTFAGKFHLVYFAIEAAAIGTGLLFLLWKPIGLWIRVVIAFCIVAYVVTAIIDAKTIGMSGGPFAASRPATPK